MSRIRQTPPAKKAITTTQNVVTSVQQTQLFQGPTPHPDIMERYDALVPGTAKRLFE